MTEVRTYMYMYTSVHGTLWSMEEREPVFEQQGPLECQGGSSYNGPSSTAHTSLYVINKRLTVKCAKYGLGPSKDFVVQTSDSSSAL